MHEYQLIYLDDTIHFVNNIVRDRQLDDLYSSKCQCE